MHFNIINFSQHKCVLKLQCVNSAASIISAFFCSCLYSVSRYLEKNLKKFLTLFDLCAIITIESQRKSKSKVIQQRFDKTKRLYKKSDLPVQIGKMLKIVLDNQ